VKPLKALVALLLLPLFHTAFLFGKWLFASIDPAAVSWLPLLVFVLGLNSWVLIYFLFPRPTWFYVLGHEITHAVAILASGGRVSGFKVRHDGGHVIADRTSAFIALSPYLIPFYPLVFGLVWGLVLLVLPAWKTYTIIFLPLWGMSWGFHFTFTASLLRAGQSDFQSQGYFFSWITILLCNFWMVLGVACFWLRPSPPMDALSVSARYLLESYGLCWQMLHACKDMFN
jgi:hypothetical protein